MSSRRSPGEGSITQRKDGRWQAALQIAGRRAIVYGRTRSEVVDKLNTLTGQARIAGHLPEAGEMTVSEFLTAWMDQAQGRLRPTTMADYTVIVRKHVSPAIGNTNLKRLSSLQLSRYYVDLGMPLSRRRVRMIHDFLHKVLGDAVRWGLITANPLAAVDAPRRETKQPVLWTPEEVSTFLQALLGGQGGNYRHLLIFLLASGCRIGEALGLRWSEVNWEQSTVRIERQLVQVGSKLVEGCPKTDSGIRTIVLPDWGIDALRRQRALAAEWRLRAGTVWQDSGRVFTTEVGTCPSRSNVKRTLHTEGDRLGLNRLRLHDLRHIHLSLLAMNGVPLKVAQVRAGHSNPSVTLRIYQHVIGDPDRQAAASLQCLAGAV